MIHKTLLISIGGQRLQESLSALRHTFEEVHVIHSVNGKALGKTQNVLHVLSDTYNVDLKTIIRPQDYELTDGHIGCFLGHYEAWKQVSQEKDDTKWFLICEDDWIAPHNLSDYINHFKTLSQSEPPPDMCYLFHLDTLVKDKSHVKQKLNDFIGTANPTFGLQSYLLNPTGARVLLRNCISNDDVSKLHVFVSDDVTSLSQNTVDVDELLNQKYKLEVDYLLMLSKLKKSWFTFEKIVTWIFIKNVGTTSNRKSNTEHWHYEIHNKCVQNIAIGKLKVKKTLQSKDA